MKQILVKTERCIGCKSCELACSTVHSESGEIISAVLKGERPVRRVSVETNTENTVNIPVQCRQCREPKCVTACMTGAMRIDETTGLVLNQEEKCVGCWMCVMVCPYGVIVPSENTRKAVKCDQCLSKGHNPACVKACPTKAIKFTEVNEFDKSRKKDFLTRFIAGEEA